MNLLTKLSTLNLYQGLAHPCPYLPNEVSTTLLVDPYRKMDSEMYDILLQQGFRRSGEFVYRPGCENCQECVSVRIPVSMFHPSRGQRRVLNKQAQTRLRRLPAEYKESHYLMYKRYLEQRHQDSDMCHGDSESYMDFLRSKWCHTEFIEFVDVNDHCFAVSVVDVTSTALSAVYTFFDPDYSCYSPGQLAILRLIQLAKSQQKSWVYLGYWIKDCKKMTYKTNYRPLQLYVGNDWIPLT